MHARKIQVKNGRLVLDEPTDLPDGAEVGSRRVPRKMALALQADPQYA